MSVAQEKIVEDKPQIFIGRQPIFDSKLKVAGYELLFRSRNVGAYDGSDGDKATTQVINNALIEIGLDDIIGENPAYINFTKDLLINGIAELLPVDRVVIEILETVEVDEELIAGVKTLVDAGYTIALDDFTYSDEWMPLIELAKIIKFDVMQHNIDEIREQIKSLMVIRLSSLQKKLKLKRNIINLKKKALIISKAIFFPNPM